MFLQLINGQTISRSFYLVVDKYERPLQNILEVNQKASSWSILASRKMAVSLGGVLLLSIILKGCPKPERENNHCLCCYHHHQPEKMIFPVQWRFNEDSIQWGCSTTTLLAMFLIFHPINWLLLDHSLFLFFKRKNLFRTFLEVQWLRIYAPNSGGMDLISD